MPSRPCRERDLGRRFRWAELADKIATWLRHGELPDAEAPELAQVVGRLGLADVKEFGLAWEDCRALLQSLGFTAKVEITAA
jgi:hypothetical protein